MERIQYLKNASKKKRETFLFPFGGPLAGIVPMAIADSDLLSATLFNSFTIVGLLNWGSTYFLGFILLDMRFNLKLLGFVIDIFNEYFNTQFQMRFW